MKPKLTKLLFAIAIFGGFLFLAAPTVSAGWTSGKFGSAINFDGVNDYVNSNSNLAAASAFSYSLWFKSSDGAFAADEYLFSQGTNDPSVYLESTDNKLKVMADGADKLSSVKTVNNTQWHHLEITADGTTIKLYLDGILESSADYTGSSAAGILYAASNATPGSYFGGIIDDVKVYSYARTSDEVLTDYNDGKAAHLGKDSQRDDGLVGYWNMEEGKGQTVYDRSGNSNNGTLGASASVAKDDPVFTSGYSSAGTGGTGLKFDGVDDYVRVPKNASINIVSGTVALWMNPKTSSTSDDGQMPLMRAESFSWSRLIYGFVHRYNGWYVFIGTGNQGVSLNYGQLTVNQWHYLAFTFQDLGNGSTELKIYKNGEFINSTIGNFIVGSGSLGYGTAYETDLGIGAKGTGGNCFNGSIDEVRIYNHALSADEIRQHYNQKKPILELKMDEGSGTTAKDDSFNSNDATFPAADANKPIWSSP